MNLRLRLCVVSGLATCCAAFAEDPEPATAPNGDSFLVPFKTPAEEFATLSQRMKLGYESNGLGVRLPPYLHRIDSETLRCMANTGDTGAAKALWFRLTVAEDEELTLMPQAEEVALTQFRLVGHTFLINETAARYAYAATRECAAEEASCRDCLTQSAINRRAAAWYMLGEKLGDPVAARGLIKLGWHSDLDLRIADSTTPLCTSELRSYVIEVRSEPDSVPANFDAAIGANGEQRFVKSTTPWSIELSATKIIAMSVVRTEGARLTAELFAREQGEVVKLGSIAGTAPLILEAVGRIGFEFRLHREGVP